MTPDFQAHVRCAHCGELVYSGDSVVVTKHTNGDDITNEFCGEHCANEFYLERLRATEGAQP